MTGRRSVLSVVMILSLCGSAAVAQQTQKPGQPRTAPTKQPPVKAPATTPATTPAATAPAAQSGVPVEPGPYVTLGRTKDWNMKSRVRIQSDDTSVVVDGQLPRVTPIGFRKVTMFWPLVPSSGSHKIDEKNLSATLRVDKTEVVSLSGASVPVVAGAHSGSALAKIEYTPDGDSAEARQFVLEVTVPTKTSSTTFDEAAAMLVPWPAGGWPAAAQSTFQPQMFIDQDSHGKYDLAPVQERIQKWLDAEKIADPKNVTPVRLAKVLAGKIVSEIQPSGKQQSMARTGELEGLMFNPPAQVLREGRGADNEIAALLALVYRSVGLPARVVIGYEGEASGSVGGVLDKGSSKSKQLRYWVEFCLFDEAKNTVNWIPVDVSKIRKTSSRPQAIDKPWRFFGTNNELEDIVPFAFTFHPSAGTVRAYGSAGFWGWIVEPSTPATAYQMLSFSVSRPSKSGADVQKDKQDRKSKLPGG